ncbi:hypothetical protein [Cytobacillus firmus]|uniref:hypothetical protein n=1 Tax=Cytobacillus firmus TaxID=1399 RepID=UPI0030026828
MTSLILIIPAIFLIPSDLTRKGKTYVIMASTIFGMLALTVKETLPAWQAVLILFLLLVSGTYLANCKINGLFHTTEKAGAFSGQLNENTEHQTIKKTDYRVNLNQQPEGMALPLIMQESELNKYEHDQIDFDPYEIEEVHLEVDIIDNAVQIDAEEKAFNTSFTQFPENNYLAELEEIINEEDEEYFRDMAMNLKV